MLIVSMKLKKVVISGKRKSSVRVMHVLNMEDCFKIILEWRVLVARKM